MRSSLGRRLLTATAITAIIGVASAAPAFARNDGAAIGLGIAGGVIAGAAIAGATAPYYAPPPPPAYYAPAPTYYAPYPSYNYPPPAPAYPPQYYYPPR